MPLLTVAILDQVKFMRNPRLLSAAEQVAGHLRSEILEGNLTGTAPGVHRLAADFGVHRRTADEALCLLENEGLLLNQGLGRPRLILKPGSVAPRGLRVGLFLYEPADSRIYETVELRHLLFEAGHALITAPKSLIELRMDVGKIARVARKMEVDAWVVLAGSDEVLDWFQNQSAPVMAYAGQASPDMRLASVCAEIGKFFGEAVRRLVSLGHRRIVVLTSSGCEPIPFRKEMEAHGIQIGSYHFPKWEQGPSGFRRCLDSLFATTPPTAMILDGAPLFLSAQHWLARRGIFAPQQVSLICSDPDPIFKWYEPSVAHMHWDTNPVVRRIVKWVANVSCGKVDQRNSRVLSKFVDGGTVGPAPRC
jgi:hypothetical protein